MAGTPTDDGLAISDPSDPYERAAQRAAERVANPPGSPARPRDPRPETPHAPAGAARDFSAIPVQRDTSKTINGVTYKTKSFDKDKERPSEVTGPVEVTETIGRDPQNADPIAGGPALGYARGHVLALSLGGANIPENVVPMFPRFNTGPWARLEGELRTEANKTETPIDVAITPKYPKDPAVPASLHLKATSGKTRTVVKEEDLSQPESIPVTEPLGPEAEEVHAAGTGRAVADQAAAQIEKEGAHDKDFAAKLKETGHLPSSPKAAYPDKPEDRFYEYLDILAYARKIDPGTRQFMANMDFSGPQKTLLLQANMRKNGGRLKSDDPSDPHQSLDERGTANVPEIDHIIPKVLGGSNYFSNARVVSWQLNNSEERIKDISGLVDVTRLALPTLPSQGKVPGEDKMSSAWEHRMRAFMPQYLPRFSGSKFTAAEFIDRFQGDYYSEYSPAVGKVVPGLLKELADSGKLKQEGEKYFLLPAFPSQVTIPGRDEPSAELEHRMREYMPKYLPLLSESPFTEEEFTDKFKADISIDAKDLPEVVHMVLDELVGSEVLTKETEGEATKYSLPPRRGASSGKSRERRESKANPYAR